MDSMEGNNFLHCLTLGFSVIRYIAFVTRLLGISDLVVNSTHVFSVGTLIFSEVNLILRNEVVWGFKVQLHALLTWALDEGGWSASFPASFDPDEISYSTH